MGQYPRPLHGFVRSSRMCFLSIAAASSVPEDGDRVVRAPPCRSAVAGGRGARRPCLRRPAAVVPSLEGDECILRAPPHQLQRRRRREGTALFASQSLQHPPPPPPFAVTEGGDCVVPPPPHVSALLSSPEGKECAVRVLPPPIAAAGVAHLVVAGGDVGCVYGLIVGGQHGIRGGEVSGRSLSLGTKK